MKVLTVVGARPQFIKAAPVSQALRDGGHREFLVHTGQHYDYGMSRVFFDELDIPEPDVNLAVGSGLHGQQTGQMLAQIETLLLEEKPDWVLVYGDTNSTLAGALAAVKLQIPLAHVEAGLRSFNREMPEEHNRVLTDHCSDVLLCPTQTAVDNLRQENIARGVHLVGDTMYDAVLRCVKMGRERSTILNRLQLETQSYALATVHRPSNTDAPENLRNILRAFQDLNQTVVFPVHPRTRKKIEELDGLDLPNSHIQMIEPVGYLDMLMLQQGAQLILTDSGGLQKEAYFLEVPCVTLRRETEWIETVEAGWNVLAGSSSAEILEAASKVAVAQRTSKLSFGNGQAAQKICEVLEGAPRTRESQA